MKLRGKIFIDGKIEALTGISIGGSKTDSIIGGIDNSIIKTSEGVPFIPGSSLKGKMRALYELRERGYTCDCSNCEICAIFGLGANKRNNEIGPTRLIVRDALLNEEVKDQMKNKEDIFKELELIYTEGKWENLINNRTSRADPRQTERVPAGAKFDFNIVFNIFEDIDVDRFYQLLSAMSMLEDDYIGGSGSRGYGRIKFIDFDLKLKSTKDYKLGNKGCILGENISNVGSLMEDKDLRTRLWEHLGAE